MGIFRAPPSPFVGGRQPLESRRLPPSESAVAADDPSFAGSARRVVALATILRAWPPPPLLPWIARYVAQGAAADDPPFGVRLRLVPLDAWQIPAPRFQAPPKFVFAVEVVAGDDPPFGQRLWLSGTLRSWIPIPPRPPITLPLNPALTDVPVHDPPGDARFRREWHSVVLQAWTPLPPQPQRAWLTAPYVVSAPSAGKYKYKFNPFTGTLDLVFIPN